MNEKKTIYLTKEGLEEMKERHSFLINTKRPANVLSIQEARAQGDLSENADYDAARNEQVEIENEIKKLEKIIEDVTIIEKTSTNEVNVGNTVKISYLEDEDVDQYEIVGSQEADPFESKISNESPIAAALLGHKVGDVVEVSSPDGNYGVKVIEIN